MTTYEAIKALKEANKSQSRLIVKLRERNGELEEAIRNFLEVDMEADDKRSDGMHAPPELYEKIKVAKRGLLKTISDKEE